MRNRVFARFDQNQKDKVTRKWLNHVADHMGEPPANPVLRECWAFLTLTRPSDPIVDDFVRDILRLIGE